MCALSALIYSTFIDDLLEDFESTLIDFLGIGVEPIIAPFFKYDLPSGLSAGPYLTDS